MKRQKTMRRVGGFAFLWAGLIVLLAVTWPATGCGTLWPTGLPAAAGAGGTSEQGASAEQIVEAGRLALLEARCVRLDEARLTWKGIGVGGGALAAAAGAATALTAGLADAEDAQWWGLGLGLGALVFGGVGLLGTTMESATAEDFAATCGELWMPAAHPLPLVLPDPGAETTPEVHFVLPAPEVSGTSPGAPAGDPPASAGSSPGLDVPGPEGTGTGEDGQLDDEGLAPAVP